MSHSHDIVFLEPSDLHQALEFLDDFLVVKVAGTTLCQRAWDSASLLCEKHALALGVIKEEWKESSNAFSQRFHLPHVAPQICHIRAARLQNSWSGSSLFKVELVDETLALLSKREAQLHQILAFRMLAQASELSPTEAFWHQKWLERLLYLTGKASLEASVRTLLESFKLKWYSLFQSPWEKISLLDRKLFVEELILIKETWAQVMKRQGRL